MRDAALEHLGGPADQVAAEGYSAQESLRLDLDGVVKAHRPEFGYVCRHRARAGGDRHPVVVQNHQQIGLRYPGVVDRFPRHSAAQGAVSDNRGHLVAISRQVPGLRYPQRRRDGRAGMPHGEAVVRAFFRLREARDSVFAPQSGKPLQPVRKYLMGVALMAHVPDDLILGGVHHREQRDCKLHHAKRRRQVPPVRAYHIDYQAPDLLGEPPHFNRRKLIQVLGQVDRFQQTLAHISSSENSRKSKVRKSGPPHTGSLSAGWRFPKRNPDPPAGFPSPAERCHSNGPIAKIVFIYTGEAEGFMLDSLRPPKRYVRC